MPYYRNLNPGGWIELTDSLLPVTSDDGTLAADSAISRWSNYMIEASDKLGRSMLSSKSYKKWLEEQGFVNVVEIIYKWPQNSWPKDQKYKELGESLPASDWFFATFSILTVTIQALGCART